MNFKKMSGDINKSRDPMKKGINGNEKSRFKVLEIDTEKKKETGIKENLSENIERIPRFSVIETDNDINNDKSINLYDSKNIPLEEYTNQRIQENLDIWSDSIGRIELARGEHDGALPVSFKAIKSLLILKEIGKTFTTCIYNEKEKKYIEYLTCIPRLKDLKTRKVLKVKGYEGHINFSSFYKKYIENLGSKNRGRLRAIESADKEGFLTGSDFFQIQSILSELLFNHPESSEIGLLNVPAAKRFIEILKGKNIVFQNLSRIITGDLADSRYLNEEEKLISSTEIAHESLQLLRTKGIGNYLVDISKGWQVYSEIGYSRDDTSVVFAVRLPFQREQDELKDYYNLI